MMRWGQRVWREFQISGDADEIVAASTPVTIVAGPGFLVAALLALAYAPGLSSVAQLDNVWWSVGFVLVGGLLTFVAYEAKTRGTFGTLATLLDNACYSTGLALAAVNSNPSVGLALALIQGLMVVLIPARYYALSLLFAVAMSTPIVVLLIVFRPTLPVGLILLASTVVMLLVSQFTKEKRTAQRRQQQLEKALGAADRLADESVQAALTTTLLTLGHFLHELRNYQMAVATNLEFVETASQLDQDAAEALSEARDAQQEQAELVRRTVDELKKGSRAVEKPFSFRDVLEGVSRRSIGPDIEWQAALDLELVGNPEHLQVVLLNLLRNAEQAGASRIYCELQPEPSGSAARVSIEDDGPGIPESERHQLFDNFVATAKPGGSGLGLYLIRRHVELLGGKVSAREGKRGGACFVLHLPGHVRRSEPLAGAPADRRERAGK